MTSFRSPCKTRMWIMALAAYAFVAGCGDSHGPHVFRLLAADGQGGNLSNLYTLDPATGAVKSTIGAIGFAVTGLAVDPKTGTLYGVTGASDPSSPGFLITINKTTGAGAIVGDLFPTNTSPVADITFTSDGTLYGWSEATDELVTISKTTGLATVVGASGISTFGSGIAASPGNVLFLTGEGVTGALRTVDRATGVTTVVATLSGGGTGTTPINALAFNGSTLYGSLSGSGTATSTLITINTTTAAITVVGPSVNKMDAIVFE